MRNNHEKFSIFLTLWSHIAKNTFRRLIMVARVPLFFIRIQILRHLFLNLGLLYAKFKRFTVTISSYSTMLSSS